MRNKTRAKKNKLFNSKMRSIYGRKWSKMKKILKNMTVVRLNDFPNVKDRRFLEYPLTHSAIVEFPSSEN